MTRSSALRLRTASAVILAIGLAACGAGPSATIGPSASTAASQTAASSASATPNGSEQPSESLAAFSCNLPIHVAATIDRAQISDLQVGLHDGYDRIVFGFVAGLPEATVETATPPFTHDPSGLAIPVAGSSFLRITLHGGTIQTLSGGSSYTGPRAFTPRAPRLVDLQPGGDFEAVATWYAGMTGAACVRVFSLSGPSRLVIDLQH